MQKYVPYIFVLLLAACACIAACGGSGSASAPIQIYDLPTVLAPAPVNPLAFTMGGAVQGTPLVLSNGNINTVSTLPNIAGIAGFGNYTTTNSPPAKFNLPNDITTDGTDFYVADYTNNVIRKITAAGEVRTLVNPLTGLFFGFNGPAGITVDGTNIYVVAYGSNTVSIIDKVTLTVTTIGSTTGLAGSVDSAVPADVRFNQPVGITTDGVNLFVTDSGNQTIRRIDINSKAVFTLAGISGAIGSSDGVRDAARFNLPWRITTDGSSLYMTDFRNRTIRQIDILTGKVSTIAGASGSLSADFGTTDGIGATARFNQPNGITTDGTYLYVTDSFENTVRRIVKSAPFNVTTISGIRSGETGIGGSVDSPGTPSFDTPIGITTDGTSLFIADSANNTIRKVH